MIGVLANESQQGMGRVEGHMPMSSPAQRTLRGQTGRHRK